MTTKELLNEHGGEWVRWGVPMVFAAGMAWALVKTVPAMQEKIQTHDMKIAVVETRLGSIDDGIADIKKSLRSESRRRSQ